MNPRAIDTAQVDFSNQPAVPSTGREQRWNRRVFAFALRRRPARASQRALPTYLVKTFAILVPFGGEKGGAHGDSDPTHGQRDANVEEGIHRCPFLNTLDRIGVACVPGSLIPADSA